MTRSQTFSSLTGAILFGGFTELSVVAVVTLEYIVAVDVVIVLPLIVVAVVAVRLLIGETLRFRIERLVGRDFMSSNKLPADGAVVAVELSIAALGDLVVAIRDDDMGFEVSFSSRLEFVSMAVDFISVEDDNMEDSSDDAFSTLR